MKINNYFNGIIHIIAALFIASTVQAKDPVKSVDKSAIPADELKLIDAIWAITYPKQHSRHLMYVQKRYLDQYGLQTPNGRTAAKDESRSRLDAVAKARWAKNLSQEFTPAELEYLRVLFSSGIIDRLNKAEGSALDSQQLVEVFNVEVNEIMKSESKPPANAAPAAAPKPNTQPTPPAVKPQVPAKK